MPHFRQPDAMSSCSYGPVSDQFSTPTVFPEVTHCRGVSPLLLACGGSFLGFLDVTITNLALPALARDFGLGLRALTWTVTIYAIVFAALLTTAGRLADLAGRRSIFLAGAAGFGLASLAAALAPSYGVLLIARAVQAAGAAAMIPASLAILLADTAPQRRAGAIGWWSAAASAAAAVGPPLGGLLVDGLGWRALFAINVPAVLILAWTARGLPNPGTQQAWRIDVLGAMLFAGGIALGVLAMTNGPAWGLADPAIIAAVAGCLLLTGLALARAARHPIPALDVRLWRTRCYAHANAISVLFGASLYATLLLGVLFLTGIWHYSVLSAGLAMTPGAFVASAVGIALGRARRQASPRILTMAGGVALGGISLTLALALPARPHFLAVWLPAGVLTGIAVAAISNGASLAGALSVKPVDFGAGTGLNIAARQIGGALGVACVAALLGHTTGLGGVRHVYLFVTVACMLTAVFGARLRFVPTPVPGPSASASAGTGAS